jgi:hypothetical protein
MIFGHFSPIAPHLTVVGLHFWDERLRGNRSSKIEGGHPKNLVSNQSDDGYRSKVDS